MKPLLSLLVGAALLLPAVLPAAQFEGRVHLKMTSENNEPLLITQAVKNDKMRTEMPAAQQAGLNGMIVDMAKNEMIILLDEQKMYMVMPIQEVEKAARGRADDAKLEKTGEKQKILGYDTEKYLVTSRDGTIELWLTDELGTFMGLGQQRGGPGAGRRGSEMQAWERLLQGKELFPLRTVGRDTRGRQTFQMEVTAVEKQSLPDTLFTPPAEYQRMDMGNMMRKMLPSIPGLPGRNK